MTGVGVVCAMALLARVAAGWLSGELAQPEVWEYEAIADSLLAGQGYAIEYFGATHRAFGFPVYPFFCALVYRLTDHSHLAVQLIQIILSSAACWQVWRIGQSLFRDGRVPLIAAGLVAAHPGLIIYASRLHSLTLDLAAFLWLLTAWIGFAQRPTGWRLFQAGVAGGVAIASRSTAAVFVLVAPVIVWGALRGVRGWSRGRILGVWVITALVLGPWLIRNAVVLGRFPVLLTSSMESLWRGNNPAASGSAFLADGREVLQADPALRARLWGLGEVAQSEAFRRETLRFVREQPAAAARLYVKKLGMFWWFSPQTGQLYPSWYRRVYALFYVPLFALALWGAWAARGLWRQPAGQLVATYLLLISVAQCVGYVDGRHRWTVEPVVLLLSAAGALALRRGGSAQAAGGAGSMSRGRLAVLFSYGTTLADWRRMGLLDRWRPILEGFCQTFGGVVLVTYGTEDRTGDAGEHIEVCPRPSWCPVPLYALLAPWLHRRALRTAGLLYVEQPSGAAAGVVAKGLFHRPLIVRWGFPWSLTLRQQGRPVAAGAAALIERTAILFADRLLATAPYGLPAEKTVIIPNGVDLGSFRPAGARQPGLICWVGRMSPEKNVELLVRAVAGLSGVTLRLIGDGPQRPAVVRLAQTLGVPVEWTGAIPHGQVARHLQAAALFVFPSAHEGCPKAPLEAMACGVPVIASDIPAHRRIIEPEVSGLLAPPDAHRLRAGIERLLADGALAQRLGAAGRQWVESHADGARLARQVRECLEAAARS
jgi:glycosyltransferase involved in cell wall biosynthesis